MEVQIGVRERDSGHLIVMLVTPYFVDSFGSSPISQKTMVFLETPVKVLPLASALKFVFGLMQSLKRSTINQADNI